MNGYEAYLTLCEEAGYLDEDGVSKPDRPDAAEALRRLIAQREIDSQVNNTAPSDPKLQNQSNREPAAKQSPNPVPSSDPAKTGLTRGQKAMIGTGAGAVALGGGYLAYKKLKKAKEKKQNAKKRQKKYLR